MWKDDVTMMSEDAVRCEKGMGGEDHLGRIEVREGQRIRHWQPNLQTR